MQFTINGSAHDLTRQQVESAVTSQVPSGITAYFVEIDGKRFPVKQVFALATGLTNREFDSGLAQRVLSRIGFDVKSTAPGASGRVPGTTRTFAGVEWGLADSDAGYEQAPSGKLHLPGCAHGVSVPVRVWSPDEALAAWTDAPDADLRALIGPGWCSDCVAIRGTTDPGLPVDPNDTTSKTGRAERSAIAEAAATVLGPGLRQQASVFDPEIVTWTAANAAALRQAVGSSTTEGSFRERLVLQLQGQPRAVVLLAAELCFVQRLPLTNVRADTKQKLLQSILDVLPDHPQVPEQIVDALGTRGVLNGGQGFNQQIAQHVVWLCSFIESWAGLSEGSREEALEDPWLFRDRVLRSGPDVAPIRNSILALVWSTYFERIVSDADKTAIRDAFASVLPEPTRDIDQDLLALRDRLDPDGALDIDWYLTPWSREWRLKKPETKKRGWSIPTAIPGSPMSLPPLDFAPAADWTRPQIREEALRAWGDGTSITDVLAQIETAASYVELMQPGDQVFTSEADGISWGVVGGLDAQLERPVAWKAPVARSDFPGAVLDVVSGAATITEVDFLLAEDRNPTPAVVSQLKLPRSTDEFATRLHYDSGWLDDVIDLLEERRQLIFFGPPGTGKTFLARALADFIAPEGAMRIVQFHPSYSYEDFFEGFRPTVDEKGTATFRLAPGPVRLLAKAAAENPSVPHVLIIDEINRANIAKVFGELYLLLEYRDARVSLQYSPEENFVLPKNLFVIGTMNTADRSISLVDSAIRRRFSFVELHPAEEPVRGLIDRWSAAHRHEVSRGALLRELNERIGDLDRDFQIGPSYLMGASARTDAGLARIWNYDILPLLDEHYYGRLSRSEVRAKFGLDALAQGALEDADREIAEAPAE